MKREIHLTHDGSFTIKVEEMKAMYHSNHGALGESQHVFIDAGLNHIGIETDPLYILEMGFGTGLNALLTLSENENSHRKIIYHTLEPFPLTEIPPTQLRYPNQIQKPHLEAAFLHMHESPWNESTVITPNFTLEKYPVKLQDFTASHKYHLVYYDAFAPSAQPELWTSAVFSHVINMMQPNGVLVTYCSKTVVRRAMEAAGFTVTKPPGPWGKREMVRAYRK